MGAPCCAVVEPGLQYVGGVHGASEVFVLGKSGLFSCFESHGFDDFGFLKLP